MGPDHRDVGLHVVEHGRVARVRLDAEPFAGLMRAITNIVGDADELQLRLSGDGVEVSLADASASDEHHTKTPRVATGRHRGVSHDQAGQAKERS